MSMGSVLWIRPAFLRFFDYDDGGGAHVEDERLKNCTLRNPEIDF
jgi:hypothetical protein